MCTKYGDVRSDFCIEQNKDFHFGNLDRDIDKSFGDGGLRKIYDTETNLPSANLTTASSDATDGRFISVGLDEIVKRINFFVLNMEEETVKKDKLKTKIRNSKKNYYGEKNIVFDPRSSRPAEEIDDKYVSHVVRNTKDQKNRNQERSTYS